MIEIENLSYSYPLSKRATLKDINLRVNDGEVVLITGASGSGKSTLLYCLNGLIPHIFEGTLSGRVKVSGVDPKEASISRMSKDAGTVFQNPEYQIFMPTVKEDIEFGCRNAGFGEEEVSSGLKKASAAMALNDMLDRQTSELSAGEKQRLAIAGIYALGPKIMLFDEPATNLDAPSKGSFRQILQRLRDDSYTVVLVEHDAGLFEDLVTSRYIMEEGRLGKISHREEIPPARKATRTARHDDAVVVEVKGLSFGHDKRSILFDSIDLAVKKGEAVAFLGDNGSGKTTFFKLLMGILKPDEGSITACGLKIRSIDDSAPRMGLLFQNPDEQLFAATVKEEIILGPRQQNKRCDCDYIMERFDLKKYENSHPHALSKGERQKVAFASIVAAGPDVIILDEPTTGLDQKSWSSLMDYASSLAGEEATILFSTHNMKAARRYASRVVTFDKGRVIRDEISQG